jgi:hypothetical protein
MEAGNAKPIKKRVVANDYDDDRDEDNNYSGRSYKKSSSGQETSSSESKARRDLFDYLDDKGVDASREAQGYRVHLKQTRNDRHGDSSRPTVTTTYSSPDGEVFASKTAVLEAIKKSKNRNFSSQPSSISSPRADIYTAAKKKYNATVKEGLPLDIDGIKVISFGTIDPDNNSFHSSVAIYPIGYKAEITVSISDHNHSNQSSRVQCEIVAKAGLPDFRVTEVTTDHSFSGSSEASVWKKVTLILN